MSILMRYVPYYMMYGMSYDEFWYSSTDRFYWQKHQFDIERRNQELWLQGLYVAAVANCLDSNKMKYPDKPQRITELTELEQKIENERKIEQLKKCAE